MIVVSDAGPLIALAQIDHFDLLPSLYGELYISPDVLAEVTTSEPQRPGSEEVRSASWIHVVETRDHVAVDLLKERLDTGESTAIVLAIEQRADVLLIDEVRGRRVAEARGLTTVGTIGTLIAGKIKRTDSICNAFIGCPCGFGISHERATVSNGPGVSQRDLTFGK